MAEDVQHHDGVVDLIEGQPVLDKTLVLVEAGGDIAGEELDQLAVLPAAVVLFKIERGVKVPQGDQRLDAIASQAGEDVAVELDTLLVRGLLIAVRIESGPGNRHPEDLEAHLGKQRDIFFIVMVEVDTIMVRVQAVVENCIVCTLRKSLAVHTKRRHLARIAVLVDIGDHTGLLDRPAGGDIGHCHASAVYIPCALELIRSRCAAPEETFWKCHDSVPHFLFSMFCSGPAIFIRPISSKTPRR